MKALLLGTLSGRHLLCPSLHRGGDPKTAFFTEPRLEYPYVTGSANTNGSASERHGQVNVKRGTSGKKNGVSHLHLFKKLSMLLFFLRAGKSRSYTSASRPSCSERRGVNMQANKAAVSTAADTSQTTWKTRTKLCVCVCSVLPAGFTFNVCSFSPLRVDTCQWQIHSRTQKGQWFINWSFRFRWPYCPLNFRLFIWASKRVWSQTTIIQAHWLVFGVEALSEVFANKPTWRRKLNLSCEEKSLNTIQTRALRKWQRT